MIKSTLMLVASVNLDTLLNMMFKIKKSISNLVFSTLTPTALHPIIINANFAKRVTL